MLLHGFTSTSSVWLHNGPSAALAEHGYRVILPDLRGHGDSARPHDAASYPSDVLVDDGLALVEWLGLADYDLGGHSIGARTVLRMLVRGARPARAVVIGQGLGSVTRERSPDAAVPPMIAESDGDPQALLQVLGSLVATPEAALTRIAVPTLVATGDEDTVDGPALAATLPDARFARVPGDHVTSLAAPELATALVAFLGGRAGH